MARTTLSMTTAAFALLAGGMAYAAISFLDSRKRCRSDEPIPSPRSTLLPHLSEAQASALPYPPNLLPGARDVDTPYGSMRIYEWGPEDGRKVVMIPGDTSPAPVFGRISKGLVHQGFRVMVIGVYVHLCGTYHSLILSQIHGAEAIPIRRKMSNTMPNFT